MKAFSWWLNVICVVAGFMVLSAAPASSASGAPAGKCSAPEYHQFDFWIGSWDAFNVDRPTKLEAHLRVDAILQGCVIHEDYQDVHGHKGQSFSIYDAPNKRWHQTWVTNRGELLLLDGEFKNGEIVLSGYDLENGKRTEIRGIWKAESGSVRETAVRSQDGGKNWEPWFDLIFRAHTR